MKPKCELLCGHDQVEEDVVVGDADAVSPRQDATVLWNKGGDARYEQDAWWLSAGATCIEKEAWAQSETHIRTTFGSAIMVSFGA
jgi:hypothetical protein